MNAQSHVLRHLATIARLMACTLFLCSVVYPMILWTIGQVFTPFTAEGWLLRDDQGQIVGSEILAQGFTSPGYFWPRPSATHYDAASSGGSNWGPTHPVLIERTTQFLNQWVAERPVPLDLITASGSGLDPHVSLEAALCQVPRVASARGVKEKLISSWVKREASKPQGILDREAVINVLRLNRILDCELGSQRVASKSPTIGMTP